MRLVNLIDKYSVEEASFLNPQVEIGSDILTRIHFATQDGGLVKLQEFLNNRLNEEIGKLSRKHGISTDSIVAISAAGNTAMTHLFLGLDPYWICREPYIPVINRPDPVKASELGLGINPEAPVLLMPGSGSYLGGDIIAGILASGMSRQDEICILVRRGNQCGSGAGKQRMADGMRRSSWSCPGGRCSKDGYDGGTRSYR